MNKTLKDLSILVIATIAITLLIWLPHYLRISDLFGLNFSSGFDTIYRNFDGLEYVLIAKSLYQSTILSQLPQSQPASYFASHFPGYAILISAFAPFFGFLKAMVIIPVLFTIFSVIAFYFLVRDFKFTSQPLFLSFIFLILPARWLIVHSVGSAEPVFIFFTILTFYCFLKFEETQKMFWIWLTGLAGMLTQLTRPPGILLFLSLILYLIWKLFKEGRTNLFRRTISIMATYSPLLLIPLTLLAVFGLYAITYQNFWAYFHSGDNIHLVFPPFQVFNINQFWVGDIWLEDIIYVFILGFLGGLLLIKQKLYPLAFFVLVYLGASCLVAHRDISRYVLPIFPFCLIAFEKILVSKEFKIVLIIMGLAIYLYAQNFLIANTAPYPNPQIFN